MQRAHTHKSENGNSLAIPPRTTKTATAKFTMRLDRTDISHRHGQSRGGARVVEQEAALHSCLCARRPSSTRTHKMSEKSMAEDWLARCGNRTLTTSAQQPGGRGGGWKMR